MSLTAKPLESLAARNNEQRQSLNNSSRTKKMDGDNWLTARQSKWIGFAVFLLAVIAVSPTQHHLQFAGFSRVLFHDTSYLSFLTPDLRQSPPLVEHPVRPDFIDPDRMEFTKAEFESREHHPSCPSGMGVVIPSFKDHFGFVSTFFETAAVNLLDRNRFKFKVIVSDELEVTELQSRLAHLINTNSSSLDVEIISLPSLLRIVLERADIPDDILAGMPGPRWKFNRFQTLKKFYGALYSNCSRTYFLDSEAKVVKEMCLKSLFDDFYARPRYFVSYMPGDEGKRQLLADAAAFLGLDVRNLPPDFWMLEVFDWVIEVDILRAMMFRIEHVYARTHDLPILAPTLGISRTLKKQVANNVRVGRQKTVYDILYDAPGSAFEMTIYELFIYTNQRLYPYYEFLTTLQQIAPFLLENFHIWFERLSPNKGHLEAPFYGLRNETFAGLLEFVDYYHLWTFRNDALELPAEARMLLCKMVQQSKYLTLQVSSDGSFPLDGGGECGLSI